MVKQWSYITVYCSCDPKVKIQLFPGYPYCLTCFQWNFAADANLRDLFRTESLWDATQSFCHARNIELSTTYTGQVTKLWQHYEAYNDNRYSFLCGNVWRDLELCWDEQSALIFWSESNSFQCSKNHQTVSHNSLELSIAWRRKSLLWSALVSFPLWAFMGPKYPYLNIHYLCYNNCWFAYKPTPAFQLGEHEASLIQNCWPTVRAPTVSQRLSRLAIVSTVYMILPEQSLWKQKSCQTWEPIINSVIWSVV